MACGGARSNHTLFAGFPPPILQPSGIPDAGRTYGRRVVITTTPFAPREP
jgi:hypothetical protein